MNDHQKLLSDEVTVGSLEDAARAATGTAVIIDVFRAFTTGAVALANGAERIVMVGGLDQAKDLRAKGVGSICMGERGGDRPEGFDFGNSPVEITDVDFSGQTLIQTTSNGTRGVLAASGAQRVYAGAFASAQATVRAILANPILPISLVAMGDAGGLRRDEDEICALYLRALLLGLTPDKDAVARAVRTMAELSDTRRMSAADADACVVFDRVDFAIPVALRGDHAIATAL
ncbi:MAG: 2-phosphosulfolactate phosphatase [Pseudomonadota bacterium]